MRNTEEQKDQLCGFAFLYMISWLSNFTFGSDYMEAGTESTIESLNKHDDDGNKNPTNLHI